MTIRLKPNLSPEMKEAVESWRMARANLQRALEAYPDDVQQDPAGPCPARPIRDPLCICPGEHDSRSAPECPASRPNCSRCGVVKGPCHRETCELREDGAPYGQGPVGPIRREPSLLGRSQSTQPVFREELVEFVRAICEGDRLFSSELVQGQRAIELAAWELYRRLQEAHEL